jgi:hypothetical protein
MPESAATEAYHRLTDGTGPPDLAAAPAAIAAAVARAAGLDYGGRAGPAATGNPAELLDALVLLRWAQAELAAIEPTLITAARAAGVSWQLLARALGVASRQAAERRYLRLVPGGPGQPGATRDGRVRAERDRRAGQRAVARWANDNTAHLRRLAGQITALTDLSDSAGADLDRLHRALGDRDAAALPALLEDAHRHLAGHPDLAGQIESVTAHTDRVRRQTQQRRTDPPPGQH